MEKFVDVILPLPLHSSFTYSLPEEMAGDVQIGCRVIVPFGRKKYYTAIVRNIHYSAPTEYEVKEVSALLDAHPILLPAQFKFWEWLADYYLCTQGDVYKAALPSGLKLESETMVEYNPDFEPDVQLSDKELKLYEEFEKEQYLEFINGQVTAATAAALTNKLLQFSNGAMYLDDGSYKVTSDKKLEALAEIVDTSQGQPILCFYSYRHDCERILRKFKGAKKLESADDIRDWNDGKIPLLLAHPAGAGHGLNLQTGGNIIVWFGLTWSLELYQQANARLYRQGQKNSVIIHHLVTDGTVDKRVLDSLQGKREVQDELLESLKEKYGV